MLDLAQQRINKEKLTQSGVLHLGYCNLTQLPQEVGELSWLQTLVLSNEYWDWEVAPITCEDRDADNHIEELPGWLEKLTSLHTLIVGGDQQNRWRLKNISVLKRLPQLKKVILSYNSIESLDAVLSLTQLRYLDAGTNYLTTLPSFASLTALEVLDISGNRLADISALEKASTLKKLYLHSNHICVLDPLRKLTNLEILRINDNQVEDISALSMLKAINNLDIRDNRIKMLRPLENLIKRLPLYWEWQNGCGIFTAGCPVEDPPEFIKLGSDSILSFWYEKDRQGTVKVYEAKLMIVGEGLAGKTSIATKIAYGRTAPMPDHNDVTDGIKISTYTTEYSGSTMRINVWDFGGQEITYSTHQFFLTHRSLYLLVDNSRQNHKRFLDYPFNYWLRVIEVLGGDSPVLIVQNEVADVKKDIEFSDMKKNVANLKECVKVNPDTYRGMPELIAEIEHYVKKLSHVGIEMPKDWEAIRSELEKEAETNNFITIDQYLTICSRHNIPEKDRALELSRFLHDLGVFLHFQDDFRLQNLFILKKEWATDAVYKLVLDPKIKENKGRFNVSSLSDLWNEKAYEGKWHELLSLMMKFELCHPIPDAGGEYLIPQLLNVEKPATQWQFTTTITLYYEYDFMPFGIMPFFIVRMHKYLLKNMNISAWRTGVRLEKTNMDTFSVAKAEIEEIELDKKKMIKICVGNGVKKDSKNEEVEKFLYLIIESFDSIHDKLNLKDKKRPKKRVPCCCALCAGTAEAYLFEYEKLKEFREWKEKHDCPQSGQPVNIDNLLRGVKAAESYGKDAVRLFISYNSKDKAFTETLVRFLEPKKACNGLEIYYDELEVPGAEWNENIISELDRADIFLFLASHDSLASKYCKMELERASVLQKERKLCIIPVILKPCNWKDTALKDFNAIPEKGIPLTDIPGTEEHKFLLVTDNLQRYLDRYFTSPFTNAFH